jgi:hypothetical protein
MALAGPQRPRGRPSAAASRKPPRSFEAVLRHAGVIGSGGSCAAPFPRRARSWRVACPPQVAPLPARAPDLGQRVPRGTAYFPRVAAYFLPQARRPKMSPPQCAQTPVLSLDRAYPLLQHNVAQTYATRLGPRSPVRASRRARRGLAREKRVASSRPRRSAGIRRAPYRARTDRAAMTLSARASSLWPGLLRNPKRSRAPRPGQPFASLRITSL